MQGNSKQEETAPGVATGMILSLRERYNKCLLYSLDSILLIFLLFLLGWDGGCLILIS